MQGNEAARLFEIWKKRNIKGVYCKNKEDALDTVLKLIPNSASVGISGSVTLGELGVVAALEARSNFVFNQYRTGITRGESLALRNEGVSADYYLASPNAVSLTGELVFFSAYGNRTSGVAGAKSVILIAGINKLVPDLDQAIKRARTIATPLNCKRLNWNTPCLRDGICDNELCAFDGYKRMCCHILIIEAEIIPERLTVVLVGEKLGY
jgi:hypothetical protein